MSDSASRDRPLFKTILRETPLWIFVASTILYFYRPLFLKETFFFRDLHLIFYPQRLRLLKLLSAGDLPLWDPYHHAGQPFLAEVNNAVLSPFIWLYWLLPVPLAFNMEIVLHVLLAGAGAYILARVLRFSPISSLVVALVYAYCGYNLSSINLAHRFLAIPYLPFLIAFWHLWLTESKSRWMIASVVTATLQLFTGALETCSISFLILLVWSFSFPFAASLTPAKRILRWLALVAFTVGLSAIQLIPTAEMVALSSRGSGYDYSVFGAWSIHPKRIPELFVPRFMGYTERLLVRDYWGAAIEGFHFPYVLSIYVGFPVFILIVCSFWQQNGILPSRALRALAALIALSIVLALGRYLPFFSTLYEALPFLHQFRYPVKLLGFITIPIALLAGAGMESLFGNQMVTQKKDRKLDALWIVVALIAAFSAMFYLSKDFSSTFVTVYFGSSSTAAADPLRRSFIHVSAVCLLAVMVLQYRKTQPRKFQAHILALVVAIDLMVAGKAANHYAPQHFLTSTPQVVREIKKRIGVARYWRDENPADIVFNIPVNDALYLDRWNFETLHNYTGTLYDIRIAYHEDYDGLANREIQELKNRIAALPWERRLPLLSAAGVKFVLSSENHPIPGFRKLGAVHNNSNVLFQLYKNERAADTVAWVSSWKATHSKEALLDSLTNASFDPRKSVMLYSDSSRENPACPPGAVKILNQTSRTMTVQVSSECDGYLVFAETLFPGWHVNIDGTATSVVRANHAFQAVFVKAGKHIIERYYLPASILWGAGITIMSCIFIVIVALKRN